MSPDSWGHKVTRNEICFQNYIKFTKDPKETKILILQFAKSIAVGHSYF